MVLFDLIFLGSFLVISDNALASDHVPAIEAEQSYVKLDLVRELFQTALDSERQSWKKLPPDFTLLLKAATYSAFALRLQQSWRLSNLALGEVSTRLHGRLSAYGIALHPSGQMLRTSVGLINLNPPGEIEEALRAIVIARGLSFWVADAAIQEAVVSCEKLVRDFHFGRRRTPASDPFSESLDRANSETEKGIEASALTQSEAHKNGSSSDAADFVLVDFSPIGKSNQDIFQMVHNRYRILIESHQFED